MKPLTLCLLIACLACGSDDPSLPDSTEADTQTTQNEATPAEEAEAEQPDDNFIDGSSPTSCGSPDQGLEPIDCTAHGDINAQCVFSNHCYCNIDEGFVCEVDSDWGSNQECAPGSSCVPITDAK